MTGSLSLEEKFESRNRRHSVILPQVDKKRYRFLALIRSQPNPKMQRRGFKWL
jgi:hypothetical protein